MHALIVNILRFWNGNHRLSTAFWMVFFPIFVGSKVASSIISGADHSSLLMTSFLIVALMLKGFSVIAVWRCAKNTDTEYKWIVWPTKIFALLSIAPIIVFSLLGLIAG